MIGMQTLRFQLGGVALVVPENGQVTLGTSEMGKTKVSPGRNRNEGRGVQEEQGQVGGGRLKASCL